MNPKDPRRLPFRTGELALLVESQQRFALIGIFDSFSGIEDGMAINFRKLIEIQPQLTDVMDLKKIKGHSRGYSIGSLDRYQGYRGESDIKRAFQKVDWLKPYQEYFSDPLKVLEDQTPN